MPSSLGTSLLVFGAICTAVNPIIGVIVAALGVLWEVSLFIRGGLG